MKPYRVNEIFYSLQGEGGRAGTANVFVRFAGCNLKCSAESEGFDCDTEFSSGRSLTGEQMVNEALDAITRAGLKHHNVYEKTKTIGVIFTGGEPGLQLTAQLVDQFKEAGFYTCIETNGTCVIPFNLDYVVCSPKSADHTLRVAQTATLESSRERVQELKYVRRKGMAIPWPPLKSEMLLISPAVQPDGHILAEDLAWCIDLVKQNPDWRLSVQQHKQWGIR